MFRETLFPLSLTYQAAMGVRNLMFDYGVRRSRSVGVPVIAIGNVTVGGTGKTPMTLLMVQMLKEKKRTVGVVSRGYKRGQSGVLAVELGPRAALTYGDEPVLIKSLHPDIPVVVGERRSVAALALLEQTPVDVIVCDDAFQHRSIHRDLNVLLLDATEPVANYRVLPVGRARESLGPALARADFVVVTKGNLLAEGEWASFTSWLEPRLRSPWLRADYRLRGFHDLSGQSREVLHEKVLLVSGIAKPQTLTALLADKVSIVQHKSFPDHHRYTDLDVEILLDEASKAQARWILSTAKDAMKLSAYPRLKERLWVVDLGLKLSGQTKELHAALDRLARPRS